ncbi:MAG: helix-turn-helix transcriptional regulator [Acidobacteria bacterium]|nr:helix-turn-helix transcriptional regulator [Acidobacteriota bacterium]
MSTFSVTDQLLQSFRASKVYRHAFVEEKVRTAIAAQIRAVREQRGFDSQTKLALEMGKTPSWISRLENPNQPPPTISTLLELAKVFDVDLNVEFAPFSEMLHKLDGLSPDSFLVPDFQTEFPERDTAIEGSLEIDHLAEYLGKAQSQEPPPPSIPVNDGTPIQKLAMAGTAVTQQGRDTGFGRAA